LKTTAQKLENNTLLVPNLKVGGPVSPGSTVVVPMGNNLGHFNYTGSP